MSDHGHDHAPPHRRDEVVEVEVDKLHLGAHDASPHGPDDVAVLAGPVDPAELVCDAPYEVAEVAH